MPTMKEVQAEADAAFAQAMIQMRAAIARREAVRLAAGGHRNLQMQFRLSIDRYSDAAHPTLEPRHSATEEAHWIRLGQPELFHLGAAVQAESVALVAAGVEA